ncbi:ATP-grasp fold amidoligase family protein [Acetobacterium bakii]|nr:ATP-grasp fold amidoligase family protein [Acetobacterium bakii]
MNSISKNRILAPMNLLYKISPQLNLKILFKIKLGYALNLVNPVTYNEKLQWIKLYEKNKLMPICCDKYLVRKFIESAGCGEILNELYWEGFDPAEIPFDTLPDTFVIKVTHGSTFNIICKNKQELNREKTVATLNRWLKAKFLPCYGEWFYGVEKPRVVVEKYLIDTKLNALYDYKIFCFHGEPRVIGVKIKRADDTIFNFYDPCFNILPDAKMVYNNDVMMSNEKPDNFEEMLDYARILSQNFLHVRVDLYDVNGKVIFGELTFTQGAGLSNIPRSFDMELGSWLKLPDMTEFINRL